MIWNARSIRKKHLEFFEFIRSHNILISLVNETHLKDSDSIFHPDFIIYRLDRGGNRRGGGVAIIVNRIVIHELLPCPQTKVIEAIAIRLCIDGRRLVVAATYYPGSDNPADLNMFVEDLHTLELLGANVILGGDFNSRHSFWGCQRANQSGNTLFREIMSGDFSIFPPDSPTHFPATGNTPSTIDFILAKGAFSPENVRTLTGLPSDHLSVSFELSDTFDSRTIPKRSIRDFSRVNWSSFGNFITRKLAERQFVSLQSPAQIDEAVEIFESTICEADRRFVPKIEIKYNHPKIDPETWALISRRRMLNRRWHRNHDTQDRDQVSNLSRQIDAALDRQVNQRFARSVQRIDRDPGPYKKKMWRLVKNLNRKSTSIPPLRTDEGILITPSEKCEAFADHLSNIPGNRTSGHRRNTFEISVDRSCDVIDQLNQSEVIPEISLQALKIEIACLKNNKAPGIDTIDNKHLKHLPDAALRFLLLIFNACLVIGYFPNRWKQSIVSCICKPGKPKNKVPSYRMVSVLPHPGKLFERFILQFVNVHLDDNNLIIPQQYGFRKGKSCVHQLKRVDGIIRRGLRARKSTGMLSLDLASAFDCVWHNGLLFKMIRLDFPVFLLKITRSFLNNRFFSVSINGTRSIPRRVMAGVPQGAVLSPSYFNIFFHDIPTPRDGELAQLADDTAFLSTSHITNTVINRLQKASRSFSRYFSKWRVKVNGSKSKVVLFTRKTATRHIPTRRIKVGGRSVDWDQNLVYLGLKFDKRLTYKDHINDKIIKGNLTLKSLYSIVNRNSRLSVPHKILLFKTIFRPGFTYASPVWMRCALSHKRRLQIFQNKILKIMLNKPRRFPTSLVHSIAAVETVEEHLDRLWVKFESGCINNMNPDIVALTSEFN